MWQCGCECVHATSDFDFDGVHSHSVTVGDYSVHTVTEWRRDRVTVHTVAVWQSGCDVTRVHSDSVTVTVYIVTVRQTPPSCVGCVAVYTQPVTIARTVTLHTVCGCLIRE